MKNDSKKKRVKAREFFIQLSTLDFFNHLRQMENIKPTSEASKLLYDIAYASNKIAFLLRAQENLDRNPQVIFFQISMIRLPDPSFQKEIDTTRDKLCKCITKFEKEDRCNANPDFKIVINSRNRLKNLQKWCRKASKANESSIDFYEHFALYCLNFAKNAEFANEIVKSIGSQKRWSLKNLVIDATKDDLEIRYLCRVAREEHLPVLDIGRQHVGEKLVSVDWDNDPNAEERLRKRLMGAKNRP